MKFRDQAFFSLGGDHDVDDDDDDDDGADYDDDHHLMY